MRCISRLCLAALCVTSLGCFSASTVENFDAGDAGETLLISLDAWKAGQAATLAKREPPIRFVDDDLSSGMVLLQFDLQTPPGEIKPFRGVAVKLVLRDRNGKTIDRLATYQISLSPKKAVLRSDP